MKVCFLSIALICISCGLNGQGCIPDTVLNGTSVIFPIPFDPEVSPNGGISDTACVGIPFSFTFTLKLPHSSGGVATIMKFELYNVEYAPPLPSFSFTCDQPDCVFFPTESGCVKITGVATEEEMGSHIVTFKGGVYYIYNGGVVYYPTTIGTFFNSSIPGNYDLVVRDSSGFENCDGLVSTNNYLKRKFNIHNYPNPFSGSTKIIVPPIATEYGFRVMTLSGREVHNEKIQAPAGNNQIDFDGSGLNNGMYIYTLTDGQAIAIQKMVIQR